MCTAAVLALGAPAGAQAFGLISSFAPTGRAAGQSMLPSGLAVGPDGLLYVAAFSNSRVEVFSPDGTFIRAFGKGVNPAGGDVCTAATGCQVGNSNPLAGAIYAPSGIDIDPTTGRLYVTSWGNYRIDVFSPAGTFLHAFGKGVGQHGGDLCTAESGCKQGVGDGSAGSLYAPSGVALDPITERLYVAGPNDRIDVFYAAGGFILAFGKGVNPAGGDVCTAATGCQKGEEVGSAGALFNPFDVAIGADNQIAVSNGGNRRIDVFSPDGTFLHAFGKGVNPAGGNLCTATTGCIKGTEGAAAGELGRPNGIAVDGDGNLVIADLTQHRVGEFAFDGTFIRAYGEGVVNGEPTFQVCSTATGCQAGNPSENPGSLRLAYAIEVDCRGAIYASTVPGLSKTPQIHRFGEPATGSPPCLPPTSPESTSSPTTSLSSSLSLSESRTAKPRFRIELNKWDGTATLAVTVSDPGMLLLRGKGIRKVKRQAKRIGLVELLLESTGKVKRKLKKTGKAKVKMSLTFTPDQGEPSTQDKPVALKMAPHS
ncbi:MAG: NHL repeat-containing protein [Solirubrobacterales bacterium]